MISLYNDNEIWIKAHNSFRLREENVLNNFDDKLKQCKRDIIIGYSLGVSVSHYLFLKYVKKYYYY